MNKRAHIRRVAAFSLDHRIKEGQFEGMHPVEQMRRGAQYSSGLEDLQSEFGVSPEGQDRALVENEEYYNRLRGLYDKHLSAPKPTLSETVAAQKDPTTISAENVPKVVSAPK